MPKLSDEETKNLLSTFDQPYHYKGKQSSCYLFESADGQFFLKFFRQSHFGRHTWRNFLPLPYTFMPQYVQKYEELIKKRIDIFTAYREAYLNKKEKPGIYYLHLNRTEDIKKSVRLVYKDRLNTTIDLDQVEFVLLKNTHE
ncbi:MAG: hypothetical protein WDZ28_01115 [Simkaniaceae bacterium]